MTPIPILYSFRRCPYAIRARLAIKVSGVQLELREVKLANKPESMLGYSPKGTVPVLVLPDGKVIDESLDIMQWALSQNDPAGWLPTDNVMQSDVDELIATNDGEFKKHLDHYKYADRFPEQSMEAYRKQGEQFLVRLESRLQSSPFLLGEKISLADMALFPFIRQFAFVDKAWFDTADYPRLQAWLAGLLLSPLFLSVMDKHKPWQPGDEVVLF